MDSCDTEYIKRCGKTERHDPHFWISHNGILGMDWDEFCDGAGVNSDILST
jgi:hypothetical protein